MVKTHKETLFSCQVCGKKFREALPGELVRPSIADLIKKKVPHWSSSGYICAVDFNKYSALYIEHVLTREKGELSRLDRQVMDSLKNYETLSRNINKEFETKLTLGDRLADKIAEFGGSWPFIITFVSFILFWIILNTFILFHPVDHFPFIMLNLILSCLAALQAPIIIMSQNRQNAKDRMRSEHDYTVDLKAELMIRHMNQKLDYFLSNQWKRLLEIQQIQVGMMEQLLRKR